jgi:transposase-like protein
MTKYYSNNNKPNPYADIPISIAASDDEDEEIMCPSCRVINYQTHGVDYEYRCTRCGHTLDVKQEVEAADIVESESMDSHNETLISNLPDPLDQYRTKRREVQGAFKTLQDKGIRLTSYTKRGGDGHVTRSWNDGSNSSSDTQRRVSAPRPMITEDRNSDSDSISNSDSEESE